jgi:pilus assembly protein CpaC
MFPGLAVTMGWFLMLMRFCGWAVLGFLDSAHPYRRGMAFAVVTTVGLLLFAGAQRAQAQGARTVESETRPVRHVSVTLFKSRTLRVEKPFATAIIGAPEIADILPMSDRSLYVQGKKIGTTNISIFDSSMQVVGVIDIEVTPDTGNLRQKIDASTNDASIHVSSNNGQVILSGEARDAVAADRAVSVAKGLSPETPIVNAMSVASSQQVMLKVRFLEVSRSADRELGFNWFVGSSGRGVSIGGQAPAIGQATGSGAAGGGSGIPLFTTVGSLAGTTAAPFGVAIANLVNHGGTTVDLMVNALETKGLVRTLAEPDLVALSGDTASFLAGGEFPVPVAQPGSTGSAPLITVDYKRFGVELTFLPTVLANGTINLRLAPSVSELDFTNAVLVSGFRIPALTKREARTTIELRDGQSFAVAGLLQATNRGDISQLPWIGSVPILGTLFRSTGYQQNETDLVIIVTPHLVRPAAPGQQVASPLDSRLPGNDVDAFLMGQLERKKKVADYVSSGGDVEGPYGHIIQLDQDSNEPAFKR